jgi:hypothetical protein
MPEKEPNPYQSPKSGPRPTRAEEEARKRRLIQYGWFVVLCVGIGLAWGLLLAWHHESWDYLLVYGIRNGLLVGLAVGIILGPLIYVSSYLESRRKRPRDRESNKE